MSDSSPNLAALVPGVGAEIVVEELPIPSPRQGEVLVRNHTVAMNPIDWKRQAWGFKVTSFPVVLGSDVAGVVAKVGPDVTAVKPGDRVVGFATEFASGKNEHGGFQTYSVINGGFLAKIPDKMSFKEAATLPQGVSTAINTLIESLALPLPTADSCTGATANLSSYILLIWGASSSVGFYSTQIARMIGVTVYAVASSANHEKLRSLGASEVFDHHSPTVIDDIVAAAKCAGKTISYAVDTVAKPETITPCMKVLANGTRTRKFAYLTPQEAPHEKGISMIQPSGEDMVDRRADLSAWLWNKALPKWLEDGALEPLPHLDVEGGISGVQEALNRLKAGVHMQKVVVEL